MDDMSGDADDESPCSSTSNLFDEIPHAVVDMMGNIQAAADSGAPPPFADESDVAAFVGAFAEPAPMFSLGGSGHLNRLARLTAHTLGIGADTGESGDTSVLAKNNSKTGRVGGKMRESEVQRI
ncbi:hypothetical protein Ddc_01159 [Ditylenchus destructor]|nr:hypothetical protein Ddc_01159 [Ditylenchus destructor]